MQRVANQHRRDLLWNVNGSRVAENILLTAALRCLPAFAARHADGVRDNTSAQLRARGARRLP